MELQILVIISWLWPAQPSPTVHDQRPTNYEFSNNLMIKKPFPYEGEKSSDGDMFHFFVFYIIPGESKMPGV